MLRTLSTRYLLAFISAGVLLANPNPAFSAADRYTVRHGDTLTAIARRTHTRVSRLERLNHLADADYLRDGQQLTLQARTAPRARSKSRAYDRAFVVRTRLVNERIAKLVRAQHARTRTPATMTAEQTTRALAANQALWMATNNGSAAGGFTLSRAYAAARRAIAFELRLTHTALRFLGVPYAWGGTSFAGVDCSGFVQTVFRRNGIELPRTADAQYEVGHLVAQNRLQPGDLVFFQTYAAGASHVGIYVGAGRFVHASSSSGVRVDSLTEAYYASRYLGARRELVL
ncbi:MAG: NlpC/P60 family protein [Candidatus Eremiobacteraeota bacterium]|nr:NlpC/P60 family protein [Candidatus Eremiobacteraeota bacterium]